ncbi:glycoside hydrolase family 65 protein [Albibacterium bauzanense]|uniref:Maltose phosphorylase n=1 Tax=Albibacterium bauzanense TaxID=653929 RepID=A0A4R1LUD7_9SPHI|nr:glycoside hydrolase family 65 protein [Albibacterium bauzanense]TCK82675.1 maltose phosphorylase [Albibacterium bauzanense]
MKNYIKIDEWNIIEEGFDPTLNKISESIFSIGNGRFGQRANFEESYSGNTLQGNYIAGIYYPDKTRVGWWKNGYPEYFAKVLNSANWIAILVEIEGEQLDLNTCKISNFKRILHMKEGYLERSFVAEFKNGKQIKVNTARFCSIADSEIGAIRYSITPLNFSGIITITSLIDGDVKNKDSNYDEKFWDEVYQEIQNEEAFLTLRTKKTAFDVCTGISTSIFNEEKPLSVKSEAISKEKWVGNRIQQEVAEKVEYTLYKYAAIVSSENYKKPELVDACKKTLKRATEKGFEKLLEEQEQAWKKKWEESDILIEGDAAAQQGIRFNIFQLNQTYTGEDARLNIGPKGFTGEKYGGSTYWDTEAYCVPFYLATAEQKVSKNLLIYRYRHLQKAIENAEKLGFEKGAALYPMVTINGEECHNEWEITFEEIHRNGAIAYAIFNYIRYTGDQDYLIDYGLEVLIGIARFWSQRVNWSEERKQFVILGVTGPNEYENNVNNNWYTNLMATWCLSYTMEGLAYVAEQSPTKYQTLIQKTNFDQEAETARWKEIIDNMYFPGDDRLGIFLQQDGYLDKEQTLVKDLNRKHYPIHQNWSWDRILRSCFIKQADVLQGLYFFEDDYDIETLRRNFDFYEARTIHESSLSPCVHSILAAKLGDEERAYDFYLRTSRLDLDDYNNDTQDGLHITSMAGTWMSVVEGFAGMRVRNNQLYFNPILPEKWSSYSFTIGFRGSKLNIRIQESLIKISNHSGKDLVVVIHNQEYSIAGKTNVEVSSLKDYQK